MLNMLNLINTLRGKGTKNVFNILLNSRTVWVGLVAMLLGIADITLLVIWGIDLPFEAPPEMLILGGLAAIYSKGGKDAKSSDTES